MSRSCTATIGSITLCSIPPSRACWPCSTGDCPRSATPWRASATTALAGTFPARRAAGAGGGVLPGDLWGWGRGVGVLSYNGRSWHIPSTRGRGIGGQDLAALGIPDEDSYIRSYCERTGSSTPEALRADWNFYLAYNLFRIAAILQGIAKRVEDGTASNAQAKASGAAARPMAQLAWSFAQRS